METQISHDPAGESWSRLAPLAVPLFRWAGGKQRFLWNFSDEIPEFEGTYHEPFAGGLSVFFHIARRSPVPVVARLGDVNLRLVRTYQEIKEDWPSVDDRLRQLEAGYMKAKDKSGFYAEVRRQHNSIAPASDAARFIFLMATGWNGVFRVNNRGEFNVPHGATKSSGPRIPTAEQLEAVSRVLQSASIRARSWESALADVRPGDFVFLDPPYHQTELRKDLYERSRYFDLRQQEALAIAVRRLQDRGAAFVLTNSGTPEMIAMYRDLGLHVREVLVQRSISSKSGNRSVESELIVTPNTALGHLKRARVVVSLTAAANRQRLRFENEEGDNDE